MDEKIYLRLLYGMEEIPDGLARIIGRNPCYDLAGLPSPKLKEEIEGFIRYRSTQVSIGRMQGDKQFYNKVRRFLKECATAKSSLRDKAPETWVKQFRTWMFKEHIPLYYRSRGPTGKENISKAREIGYFERMLKFTAVDARREEEKDVWELDKLEIEHRENPIKRVRTLNFTRISQDGIRQELKKGIYLNLQGEAIACVQKELTAARRLSRYLADRYPQVQSCRDLNREIPDLPKDGSYRDETLPCRFEPAAQSAGKHRPDVRLSKPDRTVPHKGHSANAKGGFQDLFRCGTKAAEPGDRKAGCADGTADDYPPDAGDADIRYPDPDGLSSGSGR